MARHSNRATQPLLSPLAYACGLSIGSGLFDLQSVLNQAERGGDLEQHGDDVASAGLDVPGAKRNESVIGGAAFHGANDASPDQVRA